MRASDFYIGFVESISLRVSNLKNIFRGLSKFMSANKNFQTVFHSLAASQ